MYFGCGGQRANGFALVGIEQGERCVNAEGEGKVFLVSLCINTAGIENPGSIKEGELYCFKII